MRQRRRLHPAIGESWPGPASSIERLLSELTTRYGSVESLQRVVLVGAAQLLQRRLELFGAEGRRDWA